MFIPWRSSFCAVNKDCHRLLLPSHYIPTIEWIFNDYVFISSNTFWIPLVLILFEKGIVKYYFVSANFVKCGGQAEVLSVPRGGKSCSVCSQLATPENQSPLAFLSFIQTQVMEMPREKHSCSASTTHQGEAPSLYLHTGKTVGTVFPMRLTIILLIKRSKMFSKLTDQCWSLQKCIQ